MKTSTKILSLALAGMLPMLLSAGTATAGMKDDGMMKKEMMKDDGMMKEKMKKKGHGMKKDKMIEDDGMMKNDKMMQKHM